MDAEQAHYPICQMARLLGVDRRRYYEWRARKTAPPTRRQRRMDQLVEAVTRSHTASHGTYGIRRVRADLIAGGRTVSAKTVAKAMRTAGIEGISPRSWHPATTRRGEDPKPAPDLVERHFDMGGANRAWFSDITYLAYGSHWAYLCTVRDGHTRRILGRTVSDHMRTDLVETTLRQAVALRGQLPRKVIFHADRGSQYTSGQIADLASNLPILRSMGRTGVCWDNAQAESFWSVFKAEYYNRHVFQTLNQLQQGTYTWIDAWYNARRRNSAIGYLSPLEYERHLAEQAKPN
jgi:transposase InsO family protein